ncbi:uncharacterized protein LOC116924689 isoform X4 [Daphnia magna]|uniref:uncharacterized protein LOC116924689 isoform X4 n=1 Tax=Daphnia magna TaxID=35525 RepID=UPI001E1BD05B|nr:uncharacterized protein LOC116924689 isoform X4 [Daphnia magna]
MSSTITAVNVDGIQFDRNDFLGSGRFGSVYRGTYKGQSIAVKRIKKRSDGFPSIEELKVWQQLDHPNVVKLLHCASDDDFTYLALELCDASLDQVFLNQDDPRKYKGPALTNHFEVFSQLASGLEYIHSKNLVHGNIKPENILISVKPTDCGDKVTIKWSDFEFSKAVDERETFTTSGIKGGPLWFAPELLKMFGENLSLEKTSKEGDVFAEGLVFGYIIIKGRHLYGEDSHSIMENLKDNKPVNMDQIHELHWARNLIENMVTKPPATRMTSIQVLVQLQSIKIRIVKEEEKLLQQFAEPKSDFMNMIKDFSQRGFDVNAKSQSKMNALHLLCLYNSTPNLTDAIRLLVELGIDVNAKNDRGVNALHNLCESNSTPKLTDAIQLLVQLGVDLNAKSQYKENALHRLCEYNSTPNLTEAIQQLVKLGIDVNEKGDRGMNALHYLCQNRFLGRFDETTNLTDAIQLLVKLGIDVSEKGDNGMNALHYLCQNHFLGRHDETTNLTNAIQELVKLGIDVSEKGDRGMNALHYLCQDRFLGRYDETTNLTDAIQLLVKLGIDVKAKDYRGMKAVNYLTEYRSKQERQKYEKRGGQFVDEAIRFLENAAITDFSKLKYGEYKHDRFKFVEEEEKLLQMQPSRRRFSSVLPRISGLSIHDDNVNTKDKGKRNELHVLCQSNFSPNLIIEIQRLIELGYKVNDKDKGGRNVLHYSCQYNSSPNLVEAIKLFIENGIDVNAMDNEEFNALHYLCRFNSSSNLTDAIQMLIQHGIDVNAKNFIGWNALHLSCRFHSSSNLLEILSILIEKGVDINEKTTHGDRAIDILVKNGMDEDQKSNVLRFLIRYGIQVHQENKASPNVNQMNFFKQNDNYGDKFLNFLAKKKMRLGWHEKCENCHQILSIERNSRARLQHHHMFSSCYRVFHFLMKHLEEWAKSKPNSGQSELRKSNPTEWLREKAEQYRESETGKSFKEDFEVMADVSEQVKKGSNSSEFNCDHYERYLRSMYSIAGLIECDESMGQIKWFFLLPFDFPIDYGDEKEPDIKRAKIEWDRTLFSWAHKETDEYYGKFRKEDANDGYFLPKEFKHKCHEIDGKSQNHYVEQLFRGMLETNANKRITSTEIAKQMKSIENKLYEKEEELRQLCATDSSPALVQKIRDITSLGIDVNAMDKDGRNALHYLCQHNSSSTLIDAIKLLIELGICIMSNGHDARTILRQHYNKSDIEEIIELLDGACSLLA